MNFRQWLANESLWGKVPTFKYVKNPRAYAADAVIKKEISFPVFKNPTPEELDSLTRDHHEVGGIITPNDDVYIWPRLYKSHEKMLGLLGERQMKMAFYAHPKRRIEKGYSTPYIDIDELRNHPRVREMVGRG